MMRNEPKPNDGENTNRKAKAEPGRQSPWREAELRRLIDDISARLHNVCRHMPEEEFAALVADIARLRMRFDGADPTDD
jgi:hypothetical protein